MTEKLVYAVETECSDPYYGWSVDSLHESREQAEAEMTLQAITNRGIRYRVNPWVVNGNTADKD
jgi:hypothetical protein